MLEEVVVALKEMIRNGRLSGVLVDFPPCSGLVASSESSDCGTSQPFKQARKDISNTTSPKNAQGSACK